MSAPRGRATRPRVRWFSPPRRRWPASPRWSRATGWRRPTSAAGGPTGCATRSRGCAGGRTGAASRRPCLRAPEMHGMRGGGAIILEGAIPRTGGRAGRKNCARRAPRAPTSSSTARRASRSSSSAEGSPLVIRSHPSLRMTLSKSERRWTARGSGSSAFDDPTARRSVVDPRGASAGGFRRVSEEVASLSPIFVGNELLKILRRRARRAEIGRAEPCATLATLRCAAPPPRRAAAAASSPPNR